MEREEKHWKVRNSDMNLIDKKDGKLWLSYLQRKGEIKLRNLTNIVFHKINNQQFEKKGNV
jgi:hypothetical protein